MAEVDLSFNQKLQLDFSQIFNFTKQYGEPAAV